MIYSPIELLYSPIELLYKPIESLYRERVHWLQDQHDHELWHYCFFGFVFWFRDHELRPPLFFWFRATRARSSLTGPVTFTQHSWATSLADNMNLRFLGLWKCISQIHVGPYGRKSLVTFGGWIDGEISCSVLRGCVFCFLQKHLWRKRCFCRKVMQIAVCTWSSADFPSPSWV